MLYNPTRPIHIEGGLLLCFCGSSMLYNPTSPIHIEGAAFVGGCMLHRLLYNHYI